MVIFPLFSVNVRSISEFLDDLETEKTEYKRERDKGKETLNRKIED